MKVYEKVRTYIDEHGLKRNSVAKRAHISEKVFSAIMCGKRTMYADDFEAICNALGVCASTFIEMPTRSA